jgi:pimeloyl-ACP methyl ester carboxylesterase
MPTVTSKDGTTIVYDKRGEGPALIVVDGALTTRMSGSKPQLAGLLSTQLTVYTYDRRGRGDSGDTFPYAVAREIDDIDAMIGEAGGTAALYGHSSGGSLALEAAAALGSKVRKLAIYEAPYNDDPAERPAWEKYLNDMTEALATGRPGDAVAFFMSYVGATPEQVAGARQSAFWPSLEAVAPTLAYDHSALFGPDRSVPVERAARIAVPALVMHGGASYPFMAEAAQSLCRVIPGAELRTLEGQGHDVSPDVIAPVLAAFVKG